MKFKISLLFIIVFSFNLNAQVTFNNQFCAALEHLSTLVKKHKIKEGTYTDITQNLSRFLNSSGKLSVTDQVFIEGYPMFQEDYAPAFSGRKELVNSFKILLSVVNVNLSDNKTKEEINKFINELSTTISDCGCQNFGEDTITDNILANKYYKRQWDCKKQGIITLSIDTLELSNEISQFVCYINFNFIGIY